MTETMELTEEQMQIELDQTWSMAAVGVPAGSVCSWNIEDSPKAVLQWLLDDVLDFVSPRRVFAVAEGQELPKGLESLASEQVCDGTFHAV